ncbi:type II toxin-antitoxin system VapC family toxin [Candidatus Bathyarchaeota archaeon]|nr:type II toxin-antitoxin system VapC family toxin [Candidatus Bathyarchaeota archaeon]
MLRGVSLFQRVDRETIEIAMRFDTTIYDASYVALARHLDTTLYTADQELIRKISLPCIIPISELK